MPSVMSEPTWAVAPLMSAPGVPQESCDPQQHSPCQGEWCGLGLFSTWGRLDDSGRTKHIHPGLPSHQLSHVFYEPRSTTINLPCLEEPPASCLLQLLGSLPGVHPLSWDVVPEVMTGPAFSKLSSAPVIKKLHHTALGNSQEFSWTWWALSFFLLSGQKAPGWGMAEDPCHCLGSQERVPRQAPGT